MAEQGLASNVAFLGLLDKEQLLQEYARCSAVVLASRQETMPMAVIEAMAAAKPVVAMRVGGVSELVEDGNSGYTVAPGDVEGMARHILELLDNAPLRRRMGEHARQLAERFQLETVAAQYRQLYYQVAGRAIPAHLAETNRGGVPAERDSSGSDSGPAGWILHPAKGAGWSTEP